MVMRPDSPVESLCQDDEWFKDYEWMNEQENFEEEFLNSLHIEELSKVAQAIDDEIMEAEIAQNLNDVVLSSETNANLSANENNILSAQNLDILNSSNLNPDAQEFVPRFAVSR